MHGILILGLAGLLLSFASRIIPTVSLYSTPIKIISILIIVLGVYLEGSLNTHKWYQEQTKVLQDKLNKAQAQSDKLNNDLSVEIQKNNQTITHQVDTIHTEIREKLVPIDSNCKVDPAVVSILNQAAISPLNNAETGDKK